MPQTSASRPSKKSKLAAARAKMYRELVFESAERVFAEQGYEDGTMQDIAAEAGISLKTLYATYPGKREIYRDIRKVRGAQFVDYMARVFETGKAPLEIFADGIRTYVDFILDHSNFFRIQLREGRSWGLGPDNETLTDWRKGLTMQANLLRSGIAEGVFYDCDTELMAATGIAVMQVQLAGLLEKSESPDATELTEEILRTLTRLFCKPEFVADSPLKAAR
jgi:AcrR family transcriptional regulator